MSMGRVILVTLAIAFCMAVFAFGLMLVEVRP